MEEEQELDLSKLDEAMDKEVAKNDGEDSQSESTSDEKSKESDDSSRTDTSLKTEEKESEDADKKENKEQEEDEGEDTRFDKHPRWIQREEKLKQIELERDELKEKVRLSDELKSKLGEFDLDQLVGLKKAGDLLNKYPELKDRVTKIINEHPYDKDEMNSQIKGILERQEELETKWILNKYDENVSKLMSEHKVDKEMESVVKELLDTRIVQQGIKLQDLPKAFEKLMKDINIIQRKTLANHIETKKSETRVPASPTQRGKVMATKKDSGEAEDVVAGLAAGLKAAHANFEEES